MQKLLNVYKKEGFQILTALIQYVVKKSYILVIAAIIGGALGYYYIKQRQNTYTATISFVLSTEGKEGVGIASVFSQFGFDAGMGGADNIFSGENIIELFRSRNLVGQALLANIKEENQSLLNYIANRQYPHQKDILPFPNNKSKFSAAQKKVYNIILNYVTNSFMVSKRNKLVFYYISATSTDQKEAYYIAKNILKQTSKYFIETKTQGAQNSLKLLQKESDSLSNVLHDLYQSTANVNDRTYNINPSLMVQRSGAFFNQAKAMALSGAYTEVMRNLELAKINLQKLTPLYRVIDEPDLPILPERKATMKYTVLAAFAALFLVLSIIVTRKLITLTKSKL